MPRLKFEVPAPGVNILNDVAVQTVVGLLDEIDALRYFQKAVYINSAFTATSNFDDQDGAKTVNKNRVDIDVDYILDESQVPWPMENRSNTPALGVSKLDDGRHTPIFIDRDAGIYIEHWTKPCAAHFQFKLTFQTYDDATRIMDNIRMKYKGSLIGKPFDLSFGYPIDLQFYEFLYTVYKAKTDYASKTFMDYINDHKIAQFSYDVRKSELANQSADTQLMVRTTQLKAMAQMTMDMKEPIPQKQDKVPSAYQLEFEFVIQFGRPVMISAITPISVDNTVLPPVLFSNVGLNHHNNPSVTGLYSDMLCNEFMMRSWGTFSWAGDVVRIPEYDDWFYADATYFKYDYRPLIIAHFTLDPGPTTVINLVQLDTLTLHPTAQAILKTLGQSVFSYGSLFNVSVWAGNLRLNSNLLSLDDNLNLTITSSVPNRVYHLVISETTNIQMLNVDQNELLIRYRYFFPLTMERQINDYIKKGVFKIEADTRLINLIGDLLYTGRLRPLFTAMIAAGECGNEIFHYTQNALQVSDYLEATQSKRLNYTIPTGTDAVSVAVQTYYANTASVDGRSLMVAFIEQCIISGYLTPDSVPTQALIPSRKYFPFAVTEGGYYAFNTPLRIIRFSLNAQQHRQ